MNVLLWFDDVLNDTMIIVIVHVVFVILHYCQDDDDDDDDCQRMERDRSKNSQWKSSQAITPAISVAILFEFISELLRT